MAKEAKTNAMRMLERAKVAYTAHEYPHEEGQAVDGANVARLTGQDPARVLKRWSHRALTAATMSLSCRFWRSWT